MVSLLTHICVTRPQRVNIWCNISSLSVRQLGVATGWNLWGWAISPKVPGLFRVNHRWCNMADWPRWNTGLDSNRINLVTVAVFIDTTRLDQTWLLVAKALVTNIYIFHRNIFVLIHDWMFSLGSILQSNNIGLCQWFGAEHPASHYLNTLRPRQNGRHFADDIFKSIFLNENVWIPIKISLKFFPKGPINNIPALVQIMAWRRPGDKPLSEPMMV